ncbi:hypothetical protein KUTeg_008870 [Tegillarca granosa]|uniref:Uncharacterized protein n=1 Tax=Tegillarca granosa TaxID=220873 RepID=A0ABQ9FAB9_TEGGR|nr:hypothetical protein KUTeg_008870 [Tegillarca granosa]
MTDTLTWVQALYKSSHPEYLDYIYLIAPISVMFLNPIGFAMLEIQKRRSSQTHTTKCKMFLHVAKDVITNPLVFMTFIGIIGNFIFKHTIPAVIADVLNVLGEAFNATALFYLGLSLVGKVKGRSGLHLVTPLLLIGAKTLILPIITWQFVGSLDTNASNNDTMSISMYGFLYGTFLQRHLCSYTQVISTLLWIRYIATGLVAGTLLSAPIMFISARLMTMGVNDQIDYKSLLLDTSISTSIISLVCCLLETKINQTCREVVLWVLLVLVLSRKYKRLPHQFLIYFILSHMLSCSAMVTMSSEEATDSLKHYITDSFIIIGFLSTRFLAAVMSVSLYLIHTYSLCFLIRIKWWLLSFSLGFVNITCLVLRQRQHGDSKSYSKLKDNDFIVEDTIASPNKNKRTISLPIHSKSDDDIYVKYSSLQRSHEPIVDNEGPFPSDIGSIIGPLENNINKDSIESSLSVQERKVNRKINITCRSKFCNVKHRTKCQKRLSKYFKGSPEKIFDDENTSEVYLSMGIGLFLYIWRLFNSQLGGIYVAIEFLDCVFNYGQTFTLILQLNNKALQIISCNLVFLFRLSNGLGFLQSQNGTIFRKFVYGAEAVHLPNEEDLEEETLQLRHQFIKYHLERCKMSIVTDKKQDSVSYGRSLLIGRIIEHVTSEHNFHDLPYFYRFTKNSSVINES